MSSFSRNLHLKYTIRSSLSFLTAHYYQDLRRLTFFAKKLDESQFADCYIFKMQFITKNAFLLYFIIYYSRNPLFVICHIFDNGNSLFQIGCIILIVIKVVSCISPNISRVQIKMGIWSFIIQCISLRSLNILNRLLNENQTRVSLPRILSW